MSHGVDHCWRRPAGIDGICGVSWLGQRWKGRGRWSVAGLPQGNEVLVFLYTIKCTNCQSVDLVYGKELTRRNGGTG